jgi:hypothetical protein
MTPPEDRVISIVAGCLANHDRAHSLQHIRHDDTTFVFFTCGLVVSFLVTVSGHSTWRYYSRFSISWKHTSSVGCTRERRTAVSCLFRQLSYSWNLEHERETCLPGPISPTVHTSAKTVTNDTLWIAYFASSICTSTVVSAEPSQVPSLPSISLFTPLSKSPFCIFYIRLISMSLNVVLPILPDNPDVPLRPEWLWSWGLWLWKGWGCVYSPTMMCVCDNEECEHTKHKVGTGVNSTILSETL